jgi:predicted nucleotidyltransferase
VEPNEIWEIIVKADEALKYATSEKADRRRQQAVERLHEALREAEAIGNDALAGQARTRLHDLGEGG